MSGSPEQRDSHDWTPSVSGGPRTFSSRRVVGKQNSPREPTPDVTEQMDTDKIGSMAQLIVHSHNHLSDRLGPKWRGSDNQTIAKRVAIWPHPEGGCRSPGSGTIKRIYCRGKGVTSSTVCYCFAQRTAEEERAVNGLGFCGRTKKDAFAVSGKETSGVCSENGRR